MILTSNCASGSFLDGIVPKKGGPLEITLISDKEDTRFRVKSEGDTDFREVGIGKIIKIRVPDNKPLEISAKPPGYQIKSFSLPSPTKQVQFFFLLENKVLVIHSEKENTQFRMRRSNDPKAKWLPIKEKGREIEYLVPHQGEYEIEARVPGFFPQILPVTDPLGELSFSEFVLAKSMRLLSSMDYTRFLIRNSGNGDQNWEYIGVGRTNTVQAPASGSFEISAKPYGYREKTQTLDAPKEEIDFAFTEEDKENAVSQPAQSPLRGTLLPRPPELVGKLPPADLAEITSQDSWRALLIGINDYGAAGPIYPNLSSPRNDVDQLAKTLRENYGFKSITCLLDKDATFDNVRKRLFEMDNQCVQGDNILIYYAGHGALASNKAGRWVCADGRDLANSEIEDIMVRFKARRVLLISDSCFSGDFVHRGTLLQSGPKEETLKTTVAISSAIVRTKQPARQVLTSGNLNTVPDVGTGYCQNHSPFACILLNALQSVPVGAVVGVTDLHTYISDAFVKQGVKSDELPQRANLLRADAGGEFFLLKFR